ncbi:HipA domain-containing protein [[Pseudopropionibacterium] massiliense]|uniref:HipA domain-containing protein n=1 Tax=[Pseudopropionibacterium] massiliense TaxID=2220000 RepID=UPI0013EEF036|nr:HipA domain-containing protein [[Pseudopropionibacterium] massiliense]
MLEVLECWLHGDHVGRFERQTGRAARLVYDADATRVVSLSLPIDAPAPDGAAEHYLRGLLPEDPVALRDMMRASGATSTDTFELLRQVGGDVAGAVQLTAPGSEPRSDPDHEPLIATTADIGAWIAGIKARPTASAFAGDWPLRFSLAGVQAKFALARIGGSWYRPDAQTPSTHIVKPGAARNKHIEAFEARAMDLVRRAGFAVPRARVAHFDDQSAYVVERFDRELMPSGFSRRLHVEDLQQALGRDPEGKYLTSPTDAIALLRRHDSELAYCFVEVIGRPLLPGGAQPLGGAGGAGHDVTSSPHRLRAVEQVHARRGRHPQDVRRQTVPVRVAVVAAEEPLVAVQRRQGSLPKRAEHIDGGRLPVVAGRDVGAAQPQAGAPVGLLPPRRPVVPAPGPDVAGRDDVFGRFGREMPAGVIGPGVGGELPFRACREGAREPVSHCRCPSA